MKIKYLTQTFLILCIISWNNISLCEPLRILVPKFFGPVPLSQHVRTTIYFEMVKAFQAVDTPDKGAWILYGQDDLHQQSHDEIIAAANWPSVSADLAIWGQVHKYDDGVIVQPYLTIIPLIKKRRIRPELWTLILHQNGGEALRLELDIPGYFYQFEPFPLSMETILTYENPQGIKIYSHRQGGKILGSIGEVIWFYEIHDDAILIATNGIKGWVKIKPILQQHSEAIDFSKGMVKLLRGDWRGARQNFTAVLKYSNLPQNLRIHALLYIGLAKEKGGFSGRNEFESAYSISKLDKDAAAYLLMSYAAELVRHKQSPKNIVQLDIAKNSLQQTLNATRVLFPAKDPWIHQLRRLLN